MILTFLMNIAADFFRGIATLSTNVATLPPQLVGALNFIGQSAGMLNYIIPISSMLDALVLTLTLEAAIWTFVGSVWIFRHIPFIGH